MVAEEKVGDIGARLETAPRNALKRLSHRTSVSKPSAPRTIKLLQLQPHKTTYFYLWGSLKSKVYKTHLETTSAATF